MDGIQWLASALAATRDKLENATDNLANASTDGFHRHLALVSTTDHGLHTERVMQDDRGPLRHTGRPLDFAIVGPGAFSVNSVATGTIETTRSGAFIRDKDGFLVDDLGRRLVGAGGRAIRIGPEATFRPDGTVRYGERIVDRIPLEPGSSLRTGFLESSNVNSVSEMVGVIDAQRSFETVQKTLVAMDESRSKESNDVGRLK